MSISAAVQQSLFKVKDGGAGGGGAHTTLPIPPPKPFFTPLRQALLSPLSIHFSSPLTSTRPSCSSPYLSSSSPLRTRCLSPPLLKSRFRYLCFVCAGILCSPLFSFKMGIPLSIRNMVERSCSWVISRYPRLLPIFEKRASGNRQNKRAPPSLSNIRHRPLSGSLPLEQRDGESVSSSESSRHLGSAVKHLAPSNLQSPLIEDKASIKSNVESPSTQLKRTVGSKQNEVWKIWLNISHVLVKMIYATAIGCILFTLFRKVWRPGNGSQWRMHERKIDISSPVDVSYRHD